MVHLRGVTLQLLTGGGGGGGVQGTFFVENQI